MMSLGSVGNGSECTGTGSGGAGSKGRLLAIPSRERLVRVLQYLFDEDEFLSPYGMFYGQFRFV